MSLDVAGDNDFAVIDQATGKEAGRAASVGQVDTDAAVDVAGRASRRARTSATRRKNLPLSRFAKSAGVGTFVMLAGAVTTAVMLMRSAAAADLEQQVPAVSIPARHETYDWTGFYIGGSLGYAGGHSSWASSQSGMPGSVIGRGSFGLAQSVDAFDEGGSWFNGLQIGYNYMFANRLVIGAEADVSFSALQAFAGNGLSTGGTSVLLGGAASYSDNLFDSGTVRGRIGYAPGNWLFYATGGIAWTYDQFSLTQTATGATDTSVAWRVGWAAGGGIEAPLIPHWTARLEYLYSGFGNITRTFPTTGQQFTSNLSEQQLRIGLNYQFADGGAFSGKDSTMMPGIDPDRFNFHGEAIGYWQGYPAIRSPYEGAKSLPGGGQGRETTEVGLYAGARLWNGAEFWFNPEVDQGFGIGNTLGVAGFTSVGAFKVGQAEPYARVTNAFIRQTISLGGATEEVPAGVMNFAGTQTENRLVLTAGRISELSIFDTNKYLDGKNGFFNWSYLINLAYDFGGDPWTSGYGAAAEWYQDRYALRIGVFDLTKTPATSLGGLVLDPTFSQLNFTVEVEERHELWGEPGKIKALVFIDHGKEASYADAIAWGIANGQPPLPDYVRQWVNKPGFVVNLEQQINKDVGLFAQVGWADGHYEIEDGADVSRSIIAGVVILGTQWGRPNDSVGIAGAINGISSSEQQYLNAGGYGVIIGDGKLPHAGTEQNIEAYYNYKISSSVSLTANYQLIVNPAYNTDRGPAHVFGGRMNCVF